MTEPKHRAAVLLFLLLAMPLAAAGKCRDETYTVSGRLADPRGQAVPGATVVVKWRSVAGGREASTATSLADGAYIVVFHASTFSADGPSGDSCDDKVAAVTVDVTAKGYRLASSIVPVVEKHARAEFTLHVETP